MKDDVADITAEWRKFTNQCNSDSGYAHSQAAAIERGRLDALWAKECPGLEFPQVLWSNREGRYELSGLSVSRANI